MCDYLVQTFSTVATLSEVGTLMLEFNSLTRHTGDPAFERAAARAMELLYAVTGPDLSPNPKTTFLRTVHWAPRAKAFHSLLIWSFIHRIEP